jgi:hypothetical protein
MPAALALSRYMQLYPTIFQLFCGNFMQLTKTLSRILCIAGALVLAGCASSKIGDTTKPLMPPGYGLVATSVVFTNPTQPGFMKPRWFPYHFSFETVDGQYAWGTNYPEDAVSQSSIVRAMADDAKPDLVLTPVKPGKYRLFRAHVTENSDIDMKITSGPVIEVVAGQITYAGSFWMKYYAKFSKTGTLFPREMWFSLVNDYDRDVAELKSIDKRLESVVFTNGIAK